MLDQEHFLGPKSISVKLEKQYLYVFSLGFWELSGWWGVPSL